MHCWVSLRLTQRPSSMVSSPWASSVTQSVCAQQWAQPSTWPLAAVRSRAPAMSRTEVRLPQNVRNGPGRGAPTGQLGHFQNLPPGWGVTRNLSPQNLEEEGRPLPAQRLLCYLLLHFQFKLTSEVMRRFDQGVLRWAPSPAACFQHRQHSWGPACTALSCTGPWEQRASLHSSLD